MNQTLPPLPGADVIWEDGRDQYGYPIFDEAHSDAQMKAYGHAAYKRGIEDAAEICKQASIANELSSCYRKIKELLK